MPEHRAEHQGCHRLFLPQRPGRRLAAVRVGREHLPQLFDSYALGSAEQQEHAKEVVGGRPFSADLTRGVVGFEPGLEVRAELIGTEADEPGSWMWSWANPSGFADNGHRRRPARPRRTASRRAWRADHRRDPAGRHRARLPARRWSPAALPAGTRTTRRRRRPGPPRTCCWTTRRWRCRRCSCPGAHGADRGDRERAGLGLAPRAAHVRVAAGAGGAAGRPRSSSWCTPAARASIRVDLDPQGRVANIAGRLQPAEPAEDRTRRRAFGRRKS